MLIITIIIKLIFQGKNQKQKTDWFDTVEEMLDLGTDTAVTLEQVGISLDNAKKKFCKGTDYEVVSLDGTKVVHKRSEDLIKFAGKEYERINSKGRFQWGMVTKPFIGK